MLKQAGDDSTKRILRNENQCFSTDCPKLKVIKLPRKAITRNANISSTTYINASNKMPEARAELQQSKEGLKRASLLLKDISVPISSSRNSVD